MSKSGQYAKTVEAQCEESESARMRRGSKVACELDAKVEAAAEGIVRYQFLCRKCWPSEPRKERALGWTPPRACNGCGAPVLTVEDGKFLKVEKEGAK